MCSEQIYLDFVRKGIYVNSAIPIIIIDFLRRGMRTSQKLYNKLYPLQESNLLRLVRSAPFLLYSIPAFLPFCNVNTYPFCLYNGIVTTKVWYLRTC